MGGETKRIVEPLELLRVRLIVGCMGPSRHGPSLSHSHTAASATRQKTDFHLSQKEKVHFHHAALRRFIYIHSSDRCAVWSPAKIFSPESANFENWYPLESSGPLDFVAPGRGGMGNHVSRSSQNGFFRLDFRLSG